MQNQKNQSTKSKPVQIRMSPEHHAALVALADGGPVADVIRAAVEAYVSEVCPTCDGTGRKIRTSVEEQAEEAAEAEQRRIDREDDDADYAAEKRHIAQDEAADIAKEEAPNHRCDECGNPDQPISALSPHWDRIEREDGALVCASCIKDHKAQVARIKAEQAASVEAHRKSEQRRKEEIAAAEAAEPELEGEGSDWQGNKYDLPKLTGVRAEQFGKRGMWRYFGKLTDGTEIILRKSSTQYKPFAHYYTEAVASGANGVAAHLSYSVSAKDAKANHPGRRIACLSVTKS